MTDRPILFSAPMVRALLDGRKTQTRRIINPQPTENVTSAGVIARSTEGQTDEWTWLSGDPRDADTWQAEGDFTTRFRPGDRLYVREEWCSAPAYDDLKPSGMGGEEPLRYSADDATFNWGEADGARNGRRRAGMHMPRWASRLTLIVTDVRVERLQDISEADAIAEGAFRQLGFDADPAKFTYRNGYSNLWNSINGPDAWEANPWIVAVTFTVEQRNIDA